jgi:hypothetical protein
LQTLVEILVGGLTLAIPFWFAFLDRLKFPELRWTGNTGRTPFWGHLVLVVGVGLAVLIALAAPLSGFHPTH